MHIIELAKEHPVPAVIIGGLLVVVVLHVFSGSSSGSSSSSDNGVSAYYAAASAQAQAGDAVQIAQINAQAGTAQDLINTTGSITNNTTWANTDLAENTSNNATAEVIAPISAQAGDYQALVGTLGAIASLPGTTTTSTTHGIFGGGGTYTNYTPNASATAAADELSSLVSSGLYAAH